MQRHLIIIHTSHPFGRKDGETCLPFTRDLQEAHDISYGVAGEKPSHPETLESDSSSDGKFHIPETSQPEC